MKRIGKVLLRNLYYIFSRYTLGYYIKCYTIVIAMYLITKYVCNLYLTTYELVVYLISMFFYPFSRYTYFYLKEMLLGCSNIKIPLFIYYPCKLGVFGFLLAFSIPIGGLGIIYVLIVSNCKYYLEKKEEKKVDSIDKTIDNLV